jgi:hypothetical protein
MRRDLLTHDLVPKGEKPMAFKFFLPVPVAGYIFYHLPQQRDIPFFSHNLNFKDVTLLSIINRIINEFFNENQVSELARLRGLRNKIAQEI